MYTPKNLSPSQSGMSGFYTLITRVGSATFDFSQIKDPIAYDRAICAIDTFAGMGATSRIAQIILDRLSGLTIHYSDDWAAFKYNHPGDNGTNSQLPPDGLTVGMDVYINSRGNPVGTEDIAAFSPYLCTVIHETLHTAQVHHDSQNENKTGIEGSAPYKDGVWPSLVKALARDIPKSIIDPHTGVASPVGYPDLEWRETNEDLNGKEVGQRSEIVPQGENPGREEITVNSFNDGAEVLVSKGTVDVKDDGTVLDSFATFHPDGTARQEEELVYSSDGMLTSVSQRTHFSRSSKIDYFIGGTGNNSASLDAAPGRSSASTILWGGAGVSTYYIDGSPTVYVYYVDDATEDKIRALTPEMIRAKFPQVAPTAVDDGLQPVVHAQDNSVFIINPGLNDRIYNNGVLVGDISDRLPASDVFDAWTNNQSAFTSRQDISWLNNLNEGGESNYVWFYNPPSIAAPGPDSIQPLQSGGDQSRFVAGLTIANFVLGDFGITYSGPRGSESHGYTFPDAGFASWNNRFTLDVQAGGRDGDKLSSDNGTPMAGSGAVDYEIAADTTSAFISSQDGSLGAKVEFQGNTTLSDVLVSGGGGPDGLGLVISDRVTGQTATVLDGLSLAGTRVSSVGFSDGSTISYAEILNRITTGSVTQTALYGDGDGNILDSGGYARSAQGNGGGDAFVYKSGYGILTIMEVDSNSQPNNIIQFGSGISANSLTVSADAFGNLLLGDGTSGDLITLTGQLTSSSDGIQGVVFTDGTALSAAQLIAQETTGTAGADIMYGSPAAETFDGMGAPQGKSDYAYGNGGSDTFKFASGYGRLEISETSQNNATSAILAFGQGVSSAQLVVAGDASGNVLIADGTAGDLVQLDGQLNGETRGVGQIVLADGTRFTAEQLIGMETTGTSGSDKLFGTPGADVFDGKGAQSRGGDTILGNGGGDTFVYRKGYGMLEISESDVSPTPNNILRLGSSLTKSDVTVTADRAGDILISDGVKDDQVKLDHQQSGGSVGIQSVVFDDGSILTSNDLLTMATTGTSGADNLFGTNQADVLDGRGAPVGTQDYAEGHGGGDDFVYKAGYGHLEIHENDLGTSPSNRLSMGDDITESRLSVSSDASGNLLLTDGTAGDLIKIDAVNEGGTSGLQLIGFSDGTALTRTQLQELASTGTTGADTLYGCASGLLFDGRGAPGGLRDIVNGRGAGDLVIFEKGYGQLEINDPSGFVKLGSGITQTDLHVSQDIVGVIQVTDGTPGDLIQIDRYSKVGIQFAEGSVISPDQLRALATTGTPDADVLTGMYLADVIDGKGAPGGLQDLAKGGGGGDTFIYNQGYGALLIDEVDGSGTANPGNHVQFGAGISSSQITAHLDKSYNLFIDDGSPGDEICVNAEGAHTYTADFGNGLHGIQGVKFADGSGLSQEQLIALASVATSGPDGLFGTSAAEIMDGKGAPSGFQDYLKGGGGGDTFVFGQGYGQLEIDETDAGGSARNKISLGVGIAQSQIAVHSDKSGNLFITDGTPGDQITIDGQIANSTSGTTRGIGSLNFYDGSTLSASELSQMAAVPTSGPDGLFGTSGAEVFDGKGAPLGQEDYEMGGGGGDTFAFNQGYGKLEILEVDSASNPNDTLQFGPGITLANITVRADISQNYLITDGSPGDMVILDNQGYSNGVQVVAFADGSTITGKQLQVLSTKGSSAADTIYGSNASDVFDGLGAPPGASDYINGKGGADLFTYGAGYGHLEIDETNLVFGGSSQLLFSTNVAPGQLSIGSDAVGNVIVSDGTADDRIQIDAMNTGAPNSFVQHGVGTFHFADGTVWHRGQVMAMASNGTSGSDVIVGSAGDDVLDGRGGADSIAGKGGNDTYLYRQGYGSLILDNHSDASTSTQGVVELGQGLSEQNLWFAKYGEDLLVSRLGSTDQIDVVNWFGSNPSAQVTSFKAVDGLQIRTGDVGQLLSAMASYVSANPPFNPGSAAAMPSDGNLQSALQSCWHI